MPSGRADGQGLYLEKATANVVGEVGKRRQK